ncbi:unnamed protein product [Amoebophrya sp. A120]|nr:unnamed protein product [Amoebophrya sp. A120]|eukprot:GSA120T00017516001.1
MAAQSSSFSSKGKSDRHARQTGDWVPVPRPDAVQLARESYAACGRSARFRAPYEAQVQELQHAVQTKWAFARKLYLQFLLQPLRAAAYASHPSRQLQNVAYGRARRKKRWKPLQRLADQRYELKRYAFQMLLAAAARGAAALTIQTRVARPWLARQRVRLVVWRRVELPRAATTIRRAWEGAALQRQAGRVLQLLRARLVRQVLVGAVRTFQCRQVLTRLARKQALQDEARRAREADEEQRLAVKRQAEERQREARRKREQERFFQARQNSQDVFDASAPRGGSVAGSGVATTADGERLRILSGKAPTAALEADIQMRAATRVQAAFRGRRVREANNPFSAQNRAPRPNVKVDHSGHWNLLHQRQHQGAVHRLHTVAQAAVPAPAVEDSPRGEPVGNIKDPLEAVQSHNLLHDHDGHWSMMHQRQAHRAKQTSIAPNRSLDDDGSFPQAQTAGYRNDSASGRSLDALPPSDEPETPSSSQSKDKNFLFFNDFLTGVLGGKSQSPRYKYRVLPTAENDGLALLRIPRLWLPSERANMGPEELTELRNAHRVAQGLSSGGVREPAASASPEPSSPDDLASPVHGDQNEVPPDVQEVPRERRGTATAPRLVVSHSPTTGDPTGLGSSRVADNPSPKSQVQQPGAVVSAAKKAATEGKSRAEKGSGGTESSVAQRGKGVGQRVATVQSGNIGNFSAAGGDRSAPVPGKRDVQPHQELVSQMIGEVRVERTQRKNERLRSMLRRNRGRLLGVSAFPFALKNRQERSEQEQSAQPPKEQIVVERTEKNAGLDVDDGLNAKYDVSRGSQEEVAGPPDGEKRRSDEKKPEVASATVVDDFPSLDGRGASGQPPRAPALSPQSSRVPGSAASPLLVGASEKPKSPPSYIADSIPSVAMAEDSPSRSSPQQGSPPVATQMAAHDAVAEAKSLAPSLEVLLPDRTRDAAQAQKKAAEKERLERLRRQQEEVASRRELAVAEARKRAAEIAEREAAEKARKDEIVRKAREEQARRKQLRLETAAANARNLAGDADALARGEDKEAAGSVHFPEFISPAARAPAASSNSVRPEVFDKAQPNIPREIVGASTSIASSPEKPMASSFVAAENKDLPGKQVELEVKIKAAKSAPASKEEVRKAQEERKRLQEEATRAREQERVQREERERADAEAAARVARMDEVFRRLEPVLVRLTDEVRNRELFLHMPQNDRNAVERAWPVAVKLFPQEARDLGQVAEVRVEAEAQLREVVAAAIRLQSVYRGWKIRRRGLLEERVPQSAAARRIQESWRSRKARVRTMIRTRIPALWRSQTTSSRLQLLASVHTGPFRDEIRKFLSTEVPQLKRTFFEHSRKVFEEQEVKSEIAALQRKIIGVLDSMEERGALRDTTTRPGGGVHGSSVRQRHNSTSELAFEQQILSLLRAALASKLSSLSTSSSETGTTKRTVLAGIVARGRSSFLNFMEAQNATRERAVRRLREKVHAAERAAVEEGEHYDATLQRLENHLQALRLEIQSSKYDRKMAL